MIATDQARARHVVRLCLAGVAIYPGWGLVCQLLLPQSQIAWGGRLAVAAAFALVALALRGLPRLAPHAAVAMWLAASIVTLHYAYVVVLNQFAPFYVIGVFITVAVLDAALWSVRQLAAYSGVALGACALLAATAHDANPIVWLLPTGVATLQLVVGLALAAQGALNRQLLEAHRTIALELARRERLETELREVDRRKDEFIQVVVHELRTPMAAMLGFSELIADAVDHENPQLAHYANRVGEGARRLSDLVNDLADGTRTGAREFPLAPTPTDLVALAREVEQAMAPLARERGVTLAVAAPAPVTAEVDPQRIGQVLTNLVGNALKFTPAGGSVTLEVAPAGPDVRLAVRDTGRGVPKELVGRIFERYYQVEGADAHVRQGLGLGLSIALAIVSAHGGRIGVDSEPGQGATFWCELPARRPEPC